MVDYCNQETVARLWLNVNNDGLEMVKELFKSWSPISLILCLLSFCLNLKLVTRKNQPNVATFDLLLNLLVTNCLAAFICGLGITFVKILPLSYNIVTGDCFLLILEIFQLSSLLASGLHHLVLAFQQLIEGVERQKLQT